MPGVITRGKFSSSGRAKKVAKPKLVIDEARNDISQIPTSAEEIENMRNHGGYLSLWHPESDVDRLNPFAQKERRNAKELGMSKKDFYQQVGIIYLFKPF